MGKYRTYLLRGTPVLSGPPVPAFPLDPPADADWEPNWSFESTYVNGVSISYPPEAPAWQLRARQPTLDWGEPGGTNYLPENAVGPVDAAESPSIEAQVRWAAADGTPLSDWSNPRTVTV